MPRKTTASKNRSRDTPPGASETGAPSRVCIVTREVYGLASLSDAAASTLGLAQALASRGDSVTILWVPPVEICRRYTGSLFEAAAEDFARNSLIRLEMLSDVPELSPHIHSPEKASLATYYRLKTLEFDEVLFAHEGGLGYYTLMARELGLLDASWIPVLLIHSPQDWLLEADRNLPSTLSELAINHMERYCAENAPAVAFCSRAIQRWCREKGWSIRGQGFNLPSFVPSELRSNSHLAAAQRGRGQDAELGIWPGWEFQRGLTLLCDALETVAAAGGSNTTLNVFGPLSRLLGENTGGMIIRRARDWPFKIRFFPRLTERESLDLLRAHGGIALFPDLASSGNRLLQACIETGTPAIATNAGANIEDVAHSQRSALVEPLPQSLSAAILAGMKRRPAPLTPANSSHSTFEKWRRARLKWRALRKTYTDAKRAAGSAVKTPPLVSIVMAHYDRPEFLGDAIRSVESQDYGSIELVLVDDGSRKPETLKYLKSIEPLFRSRGWKIIRQQNRYLGAARNAGIKASRGRYVLFLDDDNALLPGAVSTFVQALETSGADICTSVSKIFIGPHLPLDPHQGLIEYFPLGGSIDLALFHNSFGDANAIMRREVFGRIGYLAEDYGFVASDWEFFARAAIKGLKVRIIPEATYWYRSSAHGMFRSAHWYQTRLPILRMFKENGYRGLDDVYKLAMAQNTHESERKGYHFRLRYDLSYLPYEELNSLGPETQEALEKLAEIAASEGHAEAALSLLGQIHDGGLMRRVFNAWSTPSLAEVSLANEPLAPAEHMRLSVDMLRSFSVTSSNPKGAPPLSYVEAPSDLFVRSEPGNMVVATLAGSLPVGFIAVELSAWLAEEGASPVDIMMTLMSVDIATTNAGKLSATDAKKLILGTSGWRPLDRSFLRTSVTVRLDSPAKSAGSIIMMLRHRKTGERPLPSLVQIHDLGYSAYRGLGPARRPRSGKPPNFQPARLLTDREMRTANLATQYKGLGSLLAFKDNERGFQLVATDKGVVVAVLQWAFPPFAKGLVASVEVAEEGAPPVEFSLGLARPSNFGKWSFDGPVDGIAFSGWTQVRRSFELHDVVLEIPEVQRHHLAVCVAVRLQRSPPSTLVSTFCRKIAVRW